MKKKKRNLPSQDYLIRAALHKTNETERCEPCGKKTCLVCNSIRTTTTSTTEACGEVFKIQSGPLNCNSEKVLYLLKCKVCGEASYVGKAKTNFRYRFNNYQSKHRAFRKGNRKKPQKRFHDHYCLDDNLGIYDWDFTLFNYQFIQFYVLIYVCIYLIVLHLRY